MAAPNIVNVSSILGKTDQYALTHRVIMFLK
jgi:hypothetical protein